MDLVLTVQGTEQSIEVQADAGLLQTENANQSTSYGTRQIENLPVNGGDITNFAFSTPGLRLNAGGGNNNFNANGLPLNAGLYTMNGADITEPYNNNNKSGASNNTLGSNEIAEAAVILNAYSAQYGRMAGVHLCERFERSAIRRGHSLRLGVWHQYVQCKYRELSGRTNRSRNKFQTARLLPY